MEIIVDNLSSAYGENIVLQDIGFTVPSGSFTGIIGPNGSGKTTLLKLISRVLRPTEGSILLGGRNLAAFSQKELSRQLAVVSQESDSGCMFTAGELVTMGRAPYLGRFQSETGEDKKIVDRSLELTGCLHLRNRIMTELSGGERQRVMIARALAQRPRVLLLDEPTSHLDIGYQQEILDLVKQLNATEGMTVITVLHDLNLASCYCDTLLLLSEGKICAAGLPANVLTEEKINDAYRTRVLVTPHPVLGTPAVSLLPAKREVI